MKETTYKKIKEALIILLCSFVPLIISCSSDNKEDSIPEGKGASTALIQAIAENVPRIQSVQKDSAFSVAPGVQITKVQMTFYNKISHMFVAEVDLSTNVKAVASTPNNEPKQEYLQSIPEQALALEKAGKEVITGINGDFYGVRADGTYFSMGEFVQNGVIISDKFSEPNEAVFCIMKDETARVVDHEEFQGIKDQIEHAVGGWQRLMKGGKICEDYDVNDNSMRFDPRTFVGIAQGGKKLYIFIVDGGEGRGMDEYSNGMRLEDQMLICQGAGCTEAINFDGGGSATLVIKDTKGGFQVLNRPSDGKPRAVLNGLMIIEK